MISLRREVVRSSAGAGTILPYFLGVIRVAFPSWLYRMSNLLQNHRFGRQNDPPMNRSISTPTYPPYPGAIFLQGAVVNITLPPLFWLGCVWGGGG